MEILIVAILAILFTLALTFGFKNYGPWKSGWITFLVIFLGVWGASLWINPVGPLIYGVAWVPLFFVGLLIFFFIATTTDIDGKKIYTRSIGEGEDKLEKNSLNIFFWGFLVVLILIITLGYLQSYEYL